MSNRVSVLKAPSESVRWSRLPRRNATLLYTGLPFTFSVAVAAAHRRFARDTYNSPARAKLVLRVSSRRCTG